MKLLFGAVSPFVRKVMVTAHELGLADKLEKVPSPLSALQPNAQVIAANPVGKIPTLVLDDGTSLFDSVAICEYLESLAGTSRIFPAGPARWRALRLHALSDGLLESAMGARFETTGRPAEHQWATWPPVLMTKVTNCLDRVDAEASTFSEEPTIGEIALGCTLGWLDFRMPELDWRSGRPKLASWYELMTQRPSMTATVPRTS